MMQVILAQLGSPLRDRPYQLRPNSRPTTRITAQHSTRLVGFVFLQANKEQQRVLLPFDDLRLCRTAALRLTIRC